jgi:carbonic anhydrase/acetyltransferase-like protein (isoleucine patch superfamily)
MTYSTIRLGRSGPVVAASAWLAPGATLIGDVRLHADASIWYSAVLRADGDRIDIGSGSNVQDGCVVHADPGLPVVVGADVSVGHRAILHGCLVEDNVLIGMGAIVMDGARIGTGSLVAAGALVPEGVQIPPKSLVAGIPGKVRREITDDEHERILANARTYRQLMVRHAGAQA